MSKIDLISKYSIESGVKDTKKTLSKDASRESLWRSNYRNGLQYDVYF